MKIIKIEEDAIAKEFNTSIEFVKNTSQSLKPIGEKLNNMAESVGEILKMEHSKEKEKDAKALRLQISKIRIEAEKVRKNLGQDFLVKKRIIDSMGKTITESAKLLEKPLKDIEEYSKKVESERLNALQIKRLNEVKPYIIEIPNHEDGTMHHDFTMYSESDWSAVVGARKANYERVMAERAEAERIQKEKEAYEKAEKERLKAEAEEAKRKQAEAEDKAEAERKKQAAIIAKERAEREAAEAKIREEAKRKQAEAEAKAEAERKAAAAPDIEKLKTLAIELSGFEFPEMTTAEGEKTMRGVKTLMGKIVNYINEKQEVI